MGAGVGRVVGVGCGELVSECAKGRWNTVDGMNRLLYTSNSRIARHLVRPRCVGSGWDG